MKPELSSQQTVAMLRLANKCSPGLVSCRWPTAVLALVLMQLYMTLSAATTNDETTSDYCAPALCEIFNGTHVLQMKNTACGNNGSFGASCGPNPKLLYMSDRRRQLLLDMHNLVRNKVASGEVPGYKSATQMPLVKWDAELEHMAALHAKRCQFAHDECRNTPKYPLSGQNIGYFWIGREFKSHSRRMKSFVINWFREYRDANQSHIDSFHQHFEG